MIRRSGSGRLGEQARSRSREELNPMASVTNLVDAMLVLAVGIMLALIVSWNLNIAENGQVSNSVTKEEAVSDFSQDDVQNTEEPNEELEKQGSVYYDPETDRYYIIANDGSKMMLNQ